MYEQTGQLQKALYAYQDAEKLYDTVLRNNSTHDVSLLYSALVRLSDRLHDPDSAAAYRAKHIRTFGLHHARTRQLIAEMRARYP